MHQRLTCLGGLVLLAACSHTPSPTPMPNASAAPAGAACMQLQVSRLQVGRGTLMAAAYGSAEGFLKKPVWVAQTKADGEQLTLAVCGLVITEIAFTVFQDLNANGKLDMNPMGVPTEPYGFSGRPVFGPPAWDSAKTAAGAGRVIRIDL